MTMKKTSGQDPDFILLCAKLDAYLNHLAGGEENRKVYVPLNALSGIDDAIVFYEDEVPIAGGGFKRFEAKTAEIKRVFVSERFRGKGFGRALMLELHAMAKEKGYQKLVVETGRDMPGAVSLYRSLGYREIPNYGPYIGLENSICMEKDL